MRRFLHGELERTGVAALMREHGLAAEFFPHKDELKGDMKKVHLPLSYGRGMIWPDGREVRDLQVFLDKVEEHRLDIPEEYWLEPPAAAPRERLVVRAWHESDDAHPSDRDIEDDAQPIPGGGRRYRFVTAAVPWAMRTLPRAAGETDEAWLRRITDVLLAKMRARYAGKWAGKTDDLDWAHKIGQRFGTYLRDHGEPEDVLDRRVLDRSSTSADHSLPPLQRLISGEEQKIEWTVDPLMQAGEYGVIVGTGDSAKSTFMYYVALCLALDKPVLGRFAIRPGPVVLLSGEDGVARIRMRMRALCRGHGWSWADADDHILGLARANVVLEDPTWQRHLLREIHAVQPSLVLADPLRLLTYAKEGRNEDMVPIIHWLHRLADFDSMPTLPIVHHTGFSTANEDRAEADWGRAWSTLSRDARFVLNFTGGVKAKGEPTRVTVKLVKGNDTGYVPPFGFALHVHADDDHRWLSARFEYQTGEQLTMDDMHRALLHVMRETPGLTTNARNAAASDWLKKQGVKADRTLWKTRSDELLDAGKSSFESGPNRSQLWRATE
jgi:hypothetical protein